MVASKFTYNLLVLAESGEDPPTRYQVISPKEIPKENLIAAGFILDEGIGAGELLDISTPAASYVSLEPETAEVIPPDRAVRQTLFDLASLLAHLRDSSFSDADWVSADAAIEAAEEILGESVRGSDKS